MPDPVSPPPATLPVVDVSERVVRPRGKRLGFPTLIAGLAAIAVIVVAAVLLLNRRGAPDAASAPPASQHVAQPPVAPPSSASPSAPSAAQPAQAGGGLETGIVTLRPVWVRVLVDGERAVERELRGNERIPLRAQRTIAIRAGDAGALRVLIAGRDQGTLGRDGEVVAFEDTEAGVASAKAAGVRCIALAGTLPPVRLAQADEIVDAIDEPLLRRLLEP